MGQVFAGRAPASLVSKLVIHGFWSEAPFEWCVLAWTPFAGNTTNDVVDARFRTEVGFVTAEERAMTLAWRLACANGHDEASRCPGPWSAVWAARNGFPCEWSSDGYPGIPIRSIRSHITGSGRLRWEAVGDGSLKIEVWRGPAGDTEAHIVLSAVVPTEEPKWASSPGWNDGIEPSHIQIKAHAAYGRRHLDALLAALNAATWSAGVEGLSELNIWAGHIPVRVGDARPEPDPWDPALRPEALPTGARVRFDLGDYGIATGEATGDVPEWGQYERSWGQWLKADHDGNRWFVPVGDIVSVERDG